MTNPVAGDWYISLNGYAAYSRRLAQRQLHRRRRRRSAARPTADRSRGTGASQIQPNGTYYQTTVTGTHTGVLTGPASGADFDLYLQKWNGTAWANVASRHQLDGQRERDLQRHGRLLPVEGSLLQRQRQLHALHRPSVIGISISNRARRAIMRGGPFSYETISRSSC